MPQGDVESIMNEAYRRINENTRRLRALEERHDLTESRLDSMQSSIIKSNNSLKEKLAGLSADMKKIEEKLVILDNSISKIEKILEKTPRKSEVAELKNIMELYSPFKKK